MHLACQLAYWDGGLCIMLLYVVAGQDGTFALEGLPDGSKDEKDVNEPGGLCPGRSKRWAAQQEGV